MQAAAIPTAAMFGINRWYLPFTGALATERWSVLDLFWSTFAQYVVHTALPTFSRGFVASQNVLIDSDGHRFLDGSFLGATASALFD